LATQADSRADLPAIPAIDILDLPMPDAPVRADRPNVPFAAPRKRERNPRNPLMPVISMKKHTVSPDDVIKHLFPGAE